MKIFSINAKIGEAESKTADVFEDQNAEGSNNFIFKWPTFGLRQTL